MACLPNDRLLPSTAFDSDVCRGIGLDATLVGDPNDDRMAWLQQADGTRRDLVWPEGYKARFSPSLEVLDSHGDTLFRQGDRVAGACIAGQADAPLPLLRIRTSDVVKK
jgi:hypothetical protein